MKKITNLMMMALLSVCMGLTATPKLPATTLVYQCYYHMFDGCTSLTKAYVKANFTLGNLECTSMFTSCSASGDLYTDGATSGSPSWADASVVSAWTKHAYE